MRALRVSCIGGVMAAAVGFGVVAQTTGYPSGWFVCGFACGTAFVMALVEFGE